MVLPPFVTVVVTDDVVVDDTDELLLVLLPLTDTVVTVFPSSEIIAFCFMKFFLFLFLYLPHLMILKHTVLAFISGLL